MRCCDGNFRNDDVDTRPGDPRIRSIHHHEGSALASRLTERRADRHIDPRPRPYSTAPSTSAFLISRPPGCLDHDRGEMNPTTSETLSWPIRKQLISLATVWAVLWTLVSIIESSGYIHDPSIPRWQPITLICVLVGTIVVWLIFEISSARFLRVPLEPPRAWFFYQMRRLPLIGLGYIVMVFGLRHAIFALAGANYYHVWWAVLIPFEFIKASLFYFIWLGLVYGTLSMYRSREQAVQLSLVQQALAEAQLSRLQAQIRPHFLFNTLNTVSSLMQIDVGRADRVLTRLGDLLRASLSAVTSNSVPLREELRLLELYAEIMAERFSGRVNMVWQVDEEAFNDRIPAMLLQPLLENAFKYGIEQTTGVETIRVIAIHDQEIGMLRIAIHNTGSALDPRWREGIGVSNCRERLRVLYGNTATFDIASDGVAGVRASIGLPLGKAN